MAAIMLQTIPSFYAKTSEKSLFVSATTYEKYVVCKDYCIAHQNEKTRFYPLVNIILYYLETFKSYQRSWIHFASPINTWTVCIRYSSIDSVEKLLQRVDKCLITCNEQLTLITETREWTECRALQKRDSWGKSTKNICSAPFKRQKQRRPVVQCLQKELKKSKRLNLSWI